VVCTSCKYAVHPIAIPRHLKDIHQIRRSRRRPFMLYISKLDLDQPEAVLESNIYEFPVPVLPVQDGLRCESEGCSHLCASEKRMKIHWYSVHKRPGRAPIDWRPVPLQTFFRGNLLRYFTNPALSASPTDHHCLLTKGSDREAKSRKVQYPTAREPRVN
jgi:hypothetical protein